MVFEFPELQGLMGRYYAEAAGMPTEVGQASEEHYSPLGPSDNVPTAPVSVAVALADKLDTLTGFWAIDEKPTGSKDPYALRRAALGVIRLVLENGANGSVADWARDSAFILASLEAVRGTLAHDMIISEGFTSESYNRDFIRWKTGDFDSALTADTILEMAKEEGRSADPIADYLFYSKLDKFREFDKSEDLLSFFHDRLKVHLREEGIRHDVIDACLAMPGNDDLTLLVKRAEALAGFLKTDDGENLLQGFKRANNILSQAEEKDGVEYSFGADIKFAEDVSEKALFAALDEAQAAIAPAMEGEDFAAAMSAMAALRAPIDAFFEAVQINTDNQVVRRNRLNLLARIRDICLGVADLTRIEG
jgi:glycyl-tRNA synthetase beta chain